MGAFAKKLLIFVIGSVAADVLFAGLVNKTEGKMFFGKPKSYSQTTESLKGDVFLKEDDYRVD